ncbi:ABC transporter permease [Shewanella woodyi]|uniref:ABC transporter permease n=1 Tax=Shewanella woodyi TaxID=60961 RepID=UPI0007F9698E|nr:ABC transporter permease [Shewanella woodyi]
MLNRVFHSAYEGTVAAIESIFAHSFRSALTTLGIIIGVAAVITVVSIMEGLSQGVGNQLKDLGSDMVTIKAHTNTELEMLGVTNQLTYDDYLLIKSKVPGIKEIAAKMRAFSFGSEARFGQYSTHTQVIGTESDYQNVVNIFPLEGRFLSNTDDIKRRRVVFVGSSVLKKLNLPQHPVGEFILLGGEWFKVIGVAETRGSLFGFDQDNYIIAPFSTIRSLNGSDRTNNIDIVFRPEAGVDLTLLNDRVRNLLRSKYRLTEQDQDFFEFETAERTRKQFSDITDSITYVAAGVVGISLIVGGIGIMNIMLVSVTERTKEIGIAKALGATSRIILTQFLVEASVLALFGGIVGILLGYLLAGVVFMFMPVIGSLSVPTWAIWLALGFSGTIGVVFGIAPAIKASKLDPIDALRYE